MTSPTPIGQTPGCLSNAIKRLARKGLRPMGSTYEVQILLQKTATASQRSEEYLRKEDNNRFYPAASIPEGPEEPSDFSADRRIK